MLCAPTIESQLLLCWQGHLHNEEWCFLIVFSTCSPEIFLNHKFVITKLDNGVYQLELAQKRRLILPWMSKNTMCMTLKSACCLHNLFGDGDPTSHHSALCCFSSGSYEYTHVSYSVTILDKNFGLTPIMSLFAGDIFGNLQKHCLPKSIIIVHQHFASFLGRVCVKVKFCAISLNLTTSQETKTYLLAICVYIKHTI